MYIIPQSIANADNVNLLPWARVCTPKRNAPDSLPVDNPSGRKWGTCMGVKVKQKKKGKGNPWWVFISHNNQRTSMKVGAKQAAQAVADEVAAELKLGKFDMNREKEKPVPTF